MTDVELYAAAVLAAAAVAWRVLDIRELLRRPRVRRPYDPSSRPWGKGW